MDHLSPPVLQHRSRNSHLITESPTLRRAGASRTVAKLNQRGAYGSEFAEMSMGKRRPSVKAQKELQAIRMKIDKSHRQLEKNNVFQNLRFDMKDPTKFKEMLGIKKPEQESRLAQGRGKGLQQSFYNQSSQINQLMDQEQRGRTEMTMLKNLNKNMFYNRKVSGQGLKGKRFADAALKGTPTPESQFFSYNQNSLEQGPMYADDGMGHQRGRGSYDEDDNLYMLNLTATQTGLASTVQTEETQGARTVFHLEEGRLRRPINNASVDNLNGSGNRSQMLNGFGDPSIMTVPAGDYAGSPFIYKDQNAG